MSSTYSIPRTATFAWSKGTGSAPLLATGTVSGALDESFSNSASLEIWDAFAGNDVDEATRIKGKVAVNARFNRLAWGTPSDGRPQGILAAGMENGEVGLWDPAKILAGATSEEEASIFKTDRHKGSVRGLAWNTLQPNLLASGATDAEIFIWDTKNPSKPYGPSANKSRHLTDITALAWNPSVAHILATASASGSTVVWDLKGRQEVIHLSYQGKQESLYSQGPKPVSSVCWHAERGTRVITASEDDGAPVILVWDLRNYRTPERVLSGHEKGILSLDWCKQDPELLFSCGKDCRTLAWNPSTGEMVGELPATTNWSFDVASCPRNPSYVATASFDGKINVTSLQSTAASSEPAATTSQQPSETAADIFSAGNLSSLAAQVHPGVSLKQPPRWLKRPASSSFGFGGKLATLSTAKLAATAAPNAAPAAPAGASSQSVKVHQVVTESDIVERALRLENATDSQALSDFCNKKRDTLAASSNSSSKAVQDEMSSWKLLSSLFNADSREELVTLLGFSKEEVQKKVAEAVKTFKASSGQPGELPLGFGNNSKAAASAHSGEEHDDAGSIAREPLVTFAEQSTTVNDAMSGSSEGEGAAAKEGSQAADAAASETEASTTSVTSDATTKVGGAESEVTEPSLFGDDNNNNNAAAAFDNGTGETQGQDQATADFYSSLSAGGAETQSSASSGANLSAANLGIRPTSLSERFNLSQSNLERAGSSVAATAGSRPSSVASDSLKPSTFRIYPQDESEADRLLTRALVLGDFDSAVSLCLSADRFADALLLAVRGGADLLAKTQKAYFERRTGALPYLRLFQSIVSDDLTDVVQNGDVADWQEIFVVLCTFAKPDEYATLVEQLGQRLEYQYAVAAASSGTATPSGSALEQRRSAVLCYLAAGKLEKVVGIWVDEMKEEEKNSEQSLETSGSASARFASRAKALQSLIEKVTVFKSATAYVDTDLAAPTTQPEVAETGARTYKLAALYDRYHEYAELLAAQGLVSLAVKYAALTPADYRSANEGVSARDRLQVSSGKAIKAPTAAQQQATATKSAPLYQSATPVANGVPAFYKNGAPAFNVQQQQQSQPPQQQASQPAYDDPYAPAGGAPPAYNNGYAPSQQQPQQTSYNTNPYSAPNPYAPSGYEPSQFVPQPPQPITSPPHFGAPHGSAAAAAPMPPPAAKKAAPVGGWNDAPVVAPKRTGSAAGQQRPAVAPIFSPFPNAGGAPSPQIYSGGQPAFPGAPGGAGAVPPPPPSRGANRTPGLQQQQQQQPQQFAGPPPPRMAGQQGPPQQQQPQPQQPGFQQRPPQSMMGMQQPQQAPYPPQQQQQQGSFPPQMRMPPPQQGQGMPPPQNRFGPPQPQQQVGQYGPPQGQMQQGPPPAQQQQFIPPPPPRQQR